MARFSIVIVTYDSAKHIRSCLESIVRQDFRDYELVIVDNRSHDETRRIIDDYKGQAKLIFNESNTGFPNGVNLGISRSSGEYVLTLNPDVVLERDFLSQADRFLRQAGSRVGMAAPKMMKDALSKRIDSTGLVLSWAFRFYDRGRGKLDKGQFDARPEIFGPCAAAGIYSRKMLEEIKIDSEYFDDDFFLLIEDFDLAWRARNRGWEAAFAPQPVCYHHGGISRAKSPVGRYYSFRNRYLLILKNASALQMFRLVLLLPVYELPRFIYLFGFDNRNTRIALRELGKLIPVMLKKRSAYRKRRGNE